MTDKEKKIEIDLVDPDLWQLLKRTDKMEKELKDAIKKSGGSGSGSSGGSGSGSGSGGGY